MRADEQHAAASVTQARVGVEQVRRAVQGHHRLAGAWAAVDDQGAAGPGPDDGVLVGLDRAEHVAHPRRAVAAQAGDERRLVVEGCAALQPVGGVDLVPVVADPAAGPPVAPPARESHRLGVGRAEEGLGGRRAPVEQQSTAVAVGEAEPSDVHRLGVVGADHVPEAEVEAEAAQRPQAHGQAVDLLVTVHRLLPGASGRLELDRQPLGEVGDRVLQARLDGGEVRLVGGDQRRVCLGREPVGQVERAGGHGVHSGQLRSSTAGGRWPGRRFCATTGVLPQGPPPAIR